MKHKFLMAMAMKQAVQFVKDYDVQVDGSSLVLRHKKTGQVSRYRVTKETR